MTIQYVTFLTFLKRQITRITWKMFHSISTKFRLKVTYVTVKSTLIFKIVLYVVVHAWVGKEFTDMRQNERRIKFIRVGDAIRTAGQLKGEPVLNRGP